MRHAACVQSRLVGVAFGCEARPTRGIDAARGMGDRLSLLHDIPKIVALGVEYAIATEGARPSLPSDVPSGESGRQVVIHARHSFSRAVRDTSCLQSAHCGEGADCTHHVRMQER